MSVGFVTASGKGVQVSDKALQKARRLFEELEDGFQACCSSTNHSFNGSTPISPLFDVASRRSYKRISPAFKSPVIKNPRLENVSTANSSGFSSPLQRSSLPASSSTPQTSKNTICGDTGNITPIKLLTPYCKNWRLCIKVTSVNEIIQFRGQRMFAFLAVDSDGVEIRVSAFDGTAQKTAAIIRPDQMYYIARASVKLTSRRYSRNQHDMEVVLLPDSEVTECSDRPPISSPKVNFEFVRIQNLQNFIDTEIDVLGMVVSVGEVRQINSKSGQMLDKREIQIVDDSGYCVTVALWGQKAKAFMDGQIEHVLAAKGVFVRCFQGTVSLTTTTSSKLLLGPHFPEADALCAWYNENKGRAYKPASINQVLSFQEHKWIGQLRPSESNRVFNISAMISSMLTENAVYKGCPGCKKKLLVEKDGDLYICPKCGISDEYKYYFTLHMELVDFTGTLRVSAFDDCGQKLIGEEADEVAKFLKYDKEQYHSFFRAVLFKSYMFRIIARKRENLDRSAPVAAAMRNRTPYVWSVIDLAPLPFDSYCTFLQRTTEFVSTENFVKR